MEEGHRAFAEGLSREERLLLRLRDLLYGSSWEEVLDDLKARQDRKPVIFKLNTRIEEDLARIARLRGYEQEHQVDLADFVEADPTESEGDRG